MVSELVLGKVDVGEGEGGVQVQDEVAREGRRLYRLEHMHVITEEQVVRRMLDQEARQAHTAELHLTDDLSPGLRLVRVDKLVHLDRGQRHEAAVGEERGTPQNFGHGHAAFPTSSIVRRVGKRSA